MKISKIQVGVLAAMALVAGHSMAQNNSGAARVTNLGHGFYSANTTLAISIGETLIGSYSSTDSFISKFEQNFGSSASAGAAPVMFSESSAGNAFTSPYTVNLDVRAGTTWGANRTYASISGFEHYSTTSTTTLCTTVPGSGVCVPGLPEQTQTLDTSNQAYAHAQSRWEEIYQTGGSGGALNTTFNVHVSLGAQPGGSGVASGHSSFYWVERDFAGNRIASFSASYDASSDSWWANTYSNATGQTRSLSGPGGLAVGNGAVLTSWDGSTFDGILTGTRSFATGDVVYVDSFAQAYVWGNGLSDAENTVTLTSLSVPTGVRLFAQSGTDYGGVFSGGGGGGGLCTTPSCLGGGGGGGGGLPPVPEPETYALMLAGLGFIGWSVRRRRRAISAG